MNKVTTERLLAIYNELMTELAGFQLASFIEDAEIDKIDLPMFGLRFKLTEVSKPFDADFDIILLPNTDAVDREELFMLLASKGYIHWLRNRTSSDVLFRILEYKERWRTILEQAIKNAADEHKGEYMISLYQEMLNAPALLTIYNHDNTLFDWILT
jgi:hypothetical protein